MVDGLPPAFNVGWHSRVSVVDNWAVYMCVCAARGPVGEWICVWMDFLMCECVRLFVDVSTLDLGLSVCAGV